MNSDAGNQEGKIVRFEGEYLLYFDHFKAEIPVRYLSGDASMLMNIQVCE